MNRPLLIHIILLTALFLLSYLCIFHNLGSFQIRMWDEATYANNAIDMLTNNNPFVVEHLGKTDWYNTKPPFAIWMEAICMKFFGISEFAVRFPSAIFGLLTILLVFYFCRLVLESFFIGFIASVILITSTGYISNHVVRTGDLDSILVFWLTLGLFTTIYLVLNKPAKRTLSYVLIAASLTMGFMTKGIAGFFFLPFILIIIIFGQIRILKDKNFYFSILTSLLLCGGYYLIREFLTPGYIHLVWNTEILRYGSEVMSWHVHPFDFYFQNMLTGRFFPYIYLLPIFFVALFFAKAKKFYTLLFLSITALGYFLLISYPTIKLEWYDAPLYPLLAVLLSLSVFEIVTSVVLRFNINYPKLRIEGWLAFIILIMLLKPVNDVIKANSYPEASIYSMELEGAYIKYLQSEIPEIKSIAVFKIEKNEELYDQILFYKRALELTDKMKIRITQRTDLQKGELVMVCKEEDKLLISDFYITRLVNSWKVGVIYEITGVR